MWKVGSVFLVSIYFVGGFLLSFTGSFLNFFLVLVPTRIKEPTQNVSSPVGGKAVLQCEISGDPPLLTAGWRKGLEEIKPDLFDPFRLAEQ